MEAQAVLQNFRVSLERLEQDIVSKQKGLQDALSAKEQLDQDQEFTLNQYNGLTDDMAKAKSNLDDLIQAGQNLPEQIEMAEQELKAIQLRQAKIMVEKQSIETEIAVIRESKSAIETQIAETQNVIERSDRNIEILNDGMAETCIKLKNIEDELSNLQDAKLVAADVQALQQTIENNQNNFDAIALKLNSIKAEKQHLSDNLNALKGEASGLSTLLSRAEDNDNDDLPKGDNALINHLNVTDGYEKAVTAVLGAYLSQAGMNDNASVYWVKTSHDIIAPKGAEPLINYVDAPEALRPLLKSVGVVEDVSSYDLQPGQMVVTLDGAFMRWDGLTVRDVSVISSQDNAGMVLEHRNRLSALEKQIEEKEKILVDIESSHENLQSQNDGLKAEIDLKKSELSQKETSLRDLNHQSERLNDQLNSLKEKQTDQELRLKQNEIERAELKFRLDSLTEQANQSDQSVMESKLGQIEDWAEKLNIANAELETARQKLTQVQQSKITSKRDQTTLIAQIQKFESEAERLTARLDDFDKRHEALDAKILAYKTSSDDDSDEIREELLSKIAGQENNLTALQTDLVEKEDAYKRLQTELRKAESHAAEARENRAVIQANISNAENDLERINTDIKERFDLSPQGLEERVFSLFDNTIPDFDTLNEERDIVIRQRDSIGPVNLRAAIECEETEKHLADMEVEYTDLTKAIEQLRGGIAKLNREAKERLAIAFQRVDGHFQRLFEQLFEGGKAYLEMIQSDDPLESGLEIYAQPPGKACQKLSLLSGGEQTLTATALIFAMFMTNPSPICVLDEIDAPLDDANVDRVCTLMENIARDTNTRFIVITHHRMTMARMDRLYGVTMGERGVSQLVSVDLALQAEMELSESA
jgi:chromosome segregation protein